MNHTTSQSKEMAQLTRACREEAHAILQWWAEHMVDHERGGFYGQLDWEGTLHPDTPKGVILNTRILWSFATAARFFGTPAYQEMAERAYRYLLQNFWDSEHKGFVWLLDAEGHPIEKKKQVYAQAFAIYGLSEYVLLTGDEKALETAKEVFFLLETHSYDASSGGYLEAFGPAWETLEDVRLSSYDLNAEKTMNTHLHAPPAKS